MTGSRTTKYQQLSRKALRSATDQPVGSETELDDLINRLEQTQQRTPGDDGVIKPDPVEALREMTLRELIPAFVELAEKYSKKGISMHMDAANLLQGGREVAFEFSVGQYRSRLHGIVTSDAIAFQEIKFAPSVQGELISGPSLRLRNLTPQSFREFICGRLTTLLRTAARRH